MIVTFHDQGAEDVFNGENTKSAKKVRHEIVWRVARRKLDQLDSVVRLDELRIPPGNRLEALSRDRRGQHSISDQRPVSRLFRVDEFRPGECRTRR